ncbi:MAG: LTA synthase family protein [Eubacteriales bacterium]|nr:LTA synthase family protein [Eubacteriales bacterium]
MNEINKKAKKTINISVIRGKIKSFKNWCDKHPVTFVACLSLLMALTVESLTRRSLLDGLVFMISSPIFFLANAFILFFLYSLSLLLKKRYSLILLFTMIWLGLAVANYITTAYRITPISLNDILILPSVISIINIYLSLIELILIGAAIATAIAAVVIVIVRQKKREVAFFKTGLISAISAVLTAVLLITSMNSSAVAKDYSFIGNGYDKYGFVFSFCLSTIDRGIKKPDNYSEDYMKTIMNDINEIKTKTVKPDVNIIFLQLESFFDVNRLKNVTFSENPLPNFTRLMENYPYAFLSVPVLGAGTANTEFEVLTQMNIRFFGIGETPYKSIMQDTTCETINYDLKELGYVCHAIHNHQGTFYDRNVVYSDLGFDTFTSLEYMQNVECNPLGWAKDYVLTDEIIKALDSTKELDFVFAISVQGHGKYPDTVVDENQPIKVISGMEESHEAFEYFVNQLHEMDDFIGQLTDALSQYDEKAILVLYGDHFPSFQITEEDMTSGDVFQTEYLIWSNYGLKTKAKDIQTYQLSSKIMSVLGYNNGFLTKYHQNNSERDDYLDMLYSIQYDTLYGNKYVFNGVNPYEPTELQMGTYKIKISKVEVIGDAAFITGSGFTEWSRVRVNDTEIETIFINGNTLLILAENLSPDYSVTVAQITKNETILSETEPYKGSRD